MTYTAARCRKCTHQDSVNRKFRRLEKKRLTKKVLGTQALIDRADTIFSVYIRQRDNGVCITCGIKLPWQAMQCGHFITRQAMLTRYDERNCHAQCADCNQYHGGQLGTYARKIEERYGEKVLDELRRKKNKVAKLTPSQLFTIIDTYKPKIIWPPR